MATRYGCVRASACAFLGLVLLLTGCAARKITVSRARPAAVYRETMGSALTADRPTSGALVVLRRYGLEQEYQRHPDACLTKLWPKALADGRRDALFAVAELCFLRAKDLDRPAWRLGDRERARDTYLAAAVSAFVFLRDQQRADPLPNAYDRRLRLACDLYNTALGRALADADGRVTLQAGTRRTPLGEIEIALDASGRMAALEPLDAVLLADQYTVNGLEIRNRTSGLGTPVIAVKRRDPKRPFRQTVGATILLSCDGPTDPADGVLHGTLCVVMAGERPEVAIGDLKVPVETDQTAPLAYALSDPFVWKVGRQVFRLGQAAVHTGIYPAEPYVPGKIPVLLVHGTASSPFLWADMWNSLRADPEIRRRYQFWFYFYESSYPLLVSATNLRDCITSTVAALDPSGSDPALQQMVVIGHSQGGLLAKLTAVDTGDAFMRVLTGRALADLDISAEDRAMFQRYTVFTPLPQVRRVVFISTPHRGSYRASDFVRGAVRRLVQAPKSLTQVGSVWSRLQTRFSLPAELRSLPTSVDGMSPTSPMLRRLAEIPVAAGVHAHSIIPIKGGATPPEGKDGVVAYASAHLDGVESEYVVRDGHSCQGNPLTIEEVRRILLEHLKQGTVGSVPDRTH